MVQHIVRMNETIEKIALTYNLNISEIKNINQHIRDWDKLVAGTKLNLPSIPEIVKDHLNDVEPFIEDYYPKITNLSDLTSNEENIIKADVENSLNESKDNKEMGQKPQEVKQTKTMKEVNYPKSSIFYNGYYPPYPPYYPYYPPYNLRKRKTTI